MITMTPEVNREAEQLRQAIWELLQGHHPAACAEALLTVLVHVVRRNAHDPSTVMTALASVLALAVDDDDEPSEPLPN
ncbi:MAG TPA: hypothetical protein VIY51_20690 [Xanthobacteraceae bacterium]